MSGWLELWKQTEGFLRGVLVKPPLPGAQSLSLDLGSGYIVPQAPPGLRESRDLAHAHPLLRERYLRLKDEFQRATGHCLFETQVYRSPEAQFELYKKGREFRGPEAQRTDPLLWVIVDDRSKVTNCDGFKRKSRHNRFPSEAIDTCVDRDPGPGKVVDWKPELYKPLGELALKFGLVWGGTFRGFGPHGDYPHLEVLL